jgi:hypothetical protein
MVEQQFHQSSSPAAASYHGISQIFILKKRNHDIQVCTKYKYNPIFVKNKAGSTEAAGRFLREENT